eukprot:3931725-Prymnesium_polylepis.1
MATLAHGMGHAIVAHALAHQALFSEPHRQLMFTAARRRAQWVSQTTRVLSLSRMRVRCPGSGSDEQPRRGITPSSVLL